MNFDRTCRANVKKGILTANYAEYANSKAFPNRIRGSRVIRVFGVFRGYTLNLISAYFRSQSLLQDKLEKKGTSPKTWYWPIFRSAKFEPPASQNDPAEIGRNRSRKFLQFLENFSGVYPPGGEGVSAESGVKKKHTTAGKVMNLASQTSQTDRRSQDVGRSITQTLEHE